MKDHKKQVDKGPLKSEHISQYGKRDYDGQDVKRLSKDSKESGVQELAKTDSQQKANAYNSNK